MDINNIRKTYTNGEITVIWQSGLCTHSTICYSKLNEVFEPGRRPWIKMDMASTQEIIEVVNICPSGALTFFRNEEKKENVETVTEKTESAVATKIEVKKDGPYFISGNFIVTGADGKELPKKERMALCRCGASKNMPFCDGEHRKAGFKD